MLKGNWGLGFRELPYLEPFREASQSSVTDAVMPDAREALESDCVREVGFRV